MMRVLVLGSYWADAAESGTNMKMSNHISILLLSLSFNSMGFAVECKGIDDTQLIRDLIVAGIGDRVQLPAGTCLIHSSLNIPAHTILAGVAGGLTTLVQAAGAGDSERLLYTDGDNVTIEHLVLDGKVISNNKHTIMKEASVQ